MSEETRLAWQLANTHARAVDAERALAKAEALNAELLLAAKEAAVVISEISKLRGIDPNKGTCLQRLMAAIAKAESRQ